MSRILVTGINGQVGYELMRSLPSLGEIVGVSRDKMDWSQPDSIRKAMREIRPDLVVNAVAHKAVDQAESEPI